METVKNELKAIFKCYQYKKAICYINNCYTLSFEGITGAKITFQEKSNL